MLLFYGCPADNFGGVVSVCPAPRRGSTVVCQSPIPGTRETLL